MNPQEEIIALFESRFMQECMREQYDRLDENTIANIVKGAPVSLWRKHALFDALAKDSAFFLPYRDVYDYALAQMNPKEGSSTPAAYMATCHHIDPDSPNFDLIEIFSYACYPSMKSTMEGIRSITEYEHDKPIEEIDIWQDERSWVEVEKYEFSDGDKSALAIKYWCNIAGEPCYFDFDKPFAGTAFKIVDNKRPWPKPDDSFNLHEFWPSFINEIDIHVPLEPGDLIRIDDMPYVEPRMGVVTHRALDTIYFVSLADDDAIHETSLRYSTFFDRSCEISTLYRLDRIEERAENFEKASTWFAVAKFVREHPDAFSKLEIHLGKGYLSVGLEALLFLLKQVEAEYPEAFSESYLPKESTADDLLEFIESADIRKHCRDIGWKPSATEAAFLVWQSKFRTMRERHKAWYWIIENMPDEPILERNWICGPFPSLHKFLDEYMRTEEHLVWELFSDYKREWKPRDSYWACTIEYNNSAGGFSDYPELESLGNLALRKSPPCRSLSEMFEWLKAELEDSENEQYVESYIFEKCSFGDDTGSDTAVRYSKAMEPIELLRYNASELSEERQCVWSAFEGMWFDIPMPFEVGDVLHSVLPWQSDEFFVLTQPNADRSSMHGQAMLERHKSSGDITDMVVSGIPVKRDDGVMRPHNHYNDVLHLSRVEFEKDPRG